MGNTCKKETDSMHLSSLPPFTSKETFSPAMTGGYSPSSGSLITASRQSNLATRTPSHEMNRPSPAIFKIYRPEFAVPVFDQSLADKYAHVRYTSPLLLSDRSTYEGQLKNSLRHGFGELVDFEGGMYEGYWYRDNRHGLGRQFMTDGTVYDGRWQLDRKCGHGRLYYADGQYYEGHFDDDDRNGYGRYYLADGSFYEGNWKSGKNTGLGIFYDIATGLKKKTTIPYGI